MHEPAATLLLIGAVARETGLSKERLRIWERRYGFPAPQRDARGGQRYPLETVEKLKLVKHLCEYGHRPQRLMPLPIEALRALQVSTPASMHPVGVPAVGEAPVALLHTRDVATLRR
jgi:hypothetical protein